MKLRGLLAGSALAVASAVVADRTLRRGAGPLDPALDGDQRTVRWRGMDVAYTEAGDTEDRTLVLLHGVNAAASAREFQGVFDDLADSFHVVAPDLPGFGRSDRPPLRYDATLYRDFVADFLDRFDAPAVVATSLTASYVAADAEHASHLVLVCPSASAMGRRRPALRELVRTPVVGPALFDLGVSRPAIRRALEGHALYDPAHVTPELVDYQWRTAHQPGARFAVVAFFAGDLDTDVDLAARLGGHDADVTLVWGREAETTPLSAGRALAEEADVRLVVFDRALVQPHVEQPEAFADLVRETVA